MALQFGRSRLSELLESKRMTQAEFAHHLDVDESFISKIISGKSKFSYLKARNAAHILGCSSDDLYEWIDDSKR